MTLEESPPRFIVEIQCRSGHIWRDVWVIRHQGGEPNQGHLLSSQDSETRVHLGPHTCSLWTGRLAQVSAGEWREGLKGGEEDDYYANLLRAWTVELGLEAYCILRVWETVRSCDKATSSQIGQRCMGSEAPHLREANLLGWS